MEPRLAYYLAYIDPDTNMCISLITTSDPAQLEEPGWVQIPYYYEDYLFKYYINGAWYEDAEATIPWTPPTSR